MNRLVAVSVVLCCGGAGAAVAQGLKISVGAQGAFAEYREVDSSLAYKGSGAAGTAMVSWRKFGADVEFAKLTFDPDGGGATQSFKSTQVDVHLRYYIAGQVSLETGFTKRTMDPEFAAQSMGAVRVGVRGLYNIGPGASLALRGNYLAGSKFSGGGSAGFGIELGLGVSVGRSDGRYRLTGDYGFQRVNRKTTSAVPIQQSLARVGVAVGF